MGRDSFISHIANGMVTNDLGAYIDETPAVMVLA